MVNFFVTLTEEQKTQVVDRFESHAVDSVGVEKMMMIRERAVELASAIAVLTPVGREQSLALTNLEQTVFWANAGIARLQSK